MRPSSRLAILFIFVVLATGQAQADVYLREEVESRSFFLGIIPLAKEAFVNETWIGEGRMTTIEGNRIIIVDLAQNVLWFLNQGEREYIEARLPLDLSVLFSEDVIQRYQAQQVTGTVAETGSGREIATYNCHEYDVTFWDVTDGEQFNRRDISVWASPDVVIDYEVYYEYLESLRLLYNRDESLLTELREINGVQLGSRFRIRRPGWVQRTSSRIVEISEREPPTGTYAVPPGYVMKERLTPSDLGL